MISDYDVIEVSHHMTDLRLRLDRLYKACNIDKFRLAVLLEKEHNIGYVTRIMNNPEYLTMHELQTILNFIGYTFELSIISKPTQGDYNNDYDE